MLIMFWVSSLYFQDAIYFKASKVHKGCLRSKNDVGKIKFTAIYSHLLVIIK